MTDTEVNRLCDTCGKNTPHIISGSGHKSICLECKSQVEYGYEEDIPEEE